MIWQIRIVLWKEWKELLRGTLRALPGLPPATSLVLAPLAVGVLAAWRYPGAVGVAGPYIAAGFATLVMTGALADLFAGERERRTLEFLLSTPLSELSIFLGKVAFVVLQACYLAAATAIAGWATLALFGPGLTAIRVQTLREGAALILWLFATTAIAMLGALLSLVCQTVSRAHMALSVALAGPLLLALLLVMPPGLTDAAPATRTLPSRPALVGVIEWMRTDLDNGDRFFLAACVLVLLNGALLAIAIVMFRRERFAVQSQRPRSVLLR